MPSLQFRLILKRANTTISFEQRVSSFLRAESGAESGIIGITDRSITDLLRDVSANNMDSGAKEAKQTKRVFR